MDTDKEIWESPAEIAAELHRVMRYANDLIKRAAQADITVGVHTLDMYRAGRLIPQIDFTVRHEERRVLGRGRDADTALKNVAAVDSIPSSEMPEMELDE